MNVQTAATKLGQKAIAIGQAHHYFFELIGYGPIPDKTVVNAFWTLTPVKYPPRGFDRIKVLTDAGIPIKGYIIAHEPEIVEAPKIEEKPDTKVAPSIPVFDIAAVAGAIALGVLTVAGLILFACLRDPILIAVIDEPDPDGNYPYLVLESWYDE